MLRKISIAVVMALLAPTLLIFAELNTLDQSNLPACCRRDGKHHCAMMAGMEESQGTAFRATPEPCPFRSLASSTPLTVGYLPQASSRLFVQAVTELAFSPQPRPEFHSEVAANHHKRGPPTTLHG